LRGGGSGSEARSEHHDRRHQQTHGISSKRSGND
jgi:hypothetical protein